MPRNIVQDVIPRESRKSIRDVSLAYTSLENDEPDEQERRVRKTSRHRPIPDSGKVGTDFQRSGPPNQSRSRWFLWIICAVSALILVVLLGNVLWSATVTVVPKSQTFSINLDLTAKPKNAANELWYTAFVLTRDKDEVVTADSERNVESRGSGKIIIYNNYSASPQRLVRNTRFETPDGLVYRINNSITVPGRRALAGRTVPGSIEATVVADSAGDQYNIGLTDFTLPGFKSNAERFTAFYGRSKTPMTGGKVGTEKAVSDQKMAEVNSRLESQLTAALLAEARAQTPTDSVFFDNGYNVSFELVPAGQAGATGAVTIRKRAHFTAFYFKRDALGRAVAESSIIGFDNSPVELGKNSGLIFETKSNVGAAASGPLSFNLKGDAVILWTFDEAKLRGDLAAKNKKDLSDIVKNYPAIISAESIIRPIWKTVFPPPDKIKIVSQAPL